MEPRILTDEEIRESGYELPTCIGLSSEEQVNLHLEGARRACKAQRALTLKEVGEWLGAKGEVLWLGESPVSLILAITDLQSLLRGEMPE